MKKPRVTILTDPMPLGRELFSELIYIIVRWLRDIVAVSKPFDWHPKFRGHFAVTRSLVEGLTNIGASFNYNPKLPWLLSDTVIVLAGVRTLRQAIRLKQNGKVKKLLAGPNIVIFSSDSDSILAAPEIDHVITPSQWVADLYAEDHPFLSDKIFIWPAGVNTTYWQPKRDLERNIVLIFNKTNKGATLSLNPYLECLQAQGREVRIIEYGSYTQEKYLKLLQRACLLVGFVRSESQGIAWHEAWSCNVPTFIWRRDSYVYDGRNMRSSTAPYLNQWNGAYFDDFDDFEVKFKSWSLKSSVYSPRNWLIENLSDELCAEKIYEFALKRE